MIAVTSFMLPPKKFCSLKRLLHVDDAPSLRRVVSGQVGIEAFLRVAVGVIRAELDVLEESFGNGVGNAEPPVGVTHLARCAEIVVSACLAHCDVSYMY